MIIGISLCIPIIAGLVILSNYLEKQSIISYLLVLAVDFYGPEIEPLHKKKKQSWRQCYEYSKELNEHLLHFCVKGSEGEHCMCFPGKYYKAVRRMSDEI